MRSRILIAVTAALTIIVGLTIDATDMQAAVINDVDCPVVTADQKREQTLQQLDQLEQRGATLSPYARLVQAGIAPTHTGMSAHLMATTPRTLALQPPVNEDPGTGGGGFYAVPAGGLYLSGMFFPNSIKIVMNCWAGGSAWTGAPPGDLQSGIAVHKDGGVSNITFAYCPASAYGNCLFNWEANDVGYGVAFLWVGGRYTEPMWIPGWTVCHG